MDEVLKVLGIGALTVLLLLVIVFGGLLLLDGALFVAAAVEDGLRAIGAKARRIFEARKGGGT